MQVFVLKQSGLRQLHPSVAKVQHANLHDLT